MLLEGVEADEVTLTAVLAACWNPQDALGDGKLIHSCAAERGYDCDAFLATALVTMYGRCGSLSDAKACFDRLSSPNVVSWTSMLKNFVNAGCFDEALRCFQRMLSEGVRPNKVTFVAIFGAVSFDDAVRGRFLHDCMTEAGISCDGFLSTALITMFCRCGDLRSAESFFFSRRSMDLPSWNAMLGAYAQQQEYLEGMRLFRCLLLEDGKLFQRWIVEAGLEISVVITAALVGMFGRCGGFEEALEVFSSFESEEEPDMVLWNAMLAVCADKQPNLTIELFQRMQLQGVKQSKVGFLSVLSACAKCVNLRYGEAVYAVMLSIGDESADDSLQNAALNMFAKCCSRKNTMDLFNKLEIHWTVISCTSVIGSFAEAGHSEDAILLLRQMLLRGVMPNRITFATILNMPRFGSISMIDAELIHACIKEAGLDLELAPGLVSMYGRLKQFNRAWNVFRSADQSDVLLWNSFIASTSSCGTADELPNPFLQFRRMLQEGVVPDEVTFLTLLQECRSVEELGFINAGICEAGYGSEPVIKTALLQTLGQCRDLGSAYRVFSSMHDHEQDDVSWSSMVTVFADNGRECEAIYLLRRMQLQGIKPLKSAFIKAINACAAAASGNAAASLHAIVDAAGLTSDVAVGSALVSLFGRLKRPDAGQEVFDKIMQKKDVCSWTALLSAFAESDRHGKALEIFWEMQQAGVEADNVCVVAVLESWMIVSGEDGSLCFAEEFLDDALVATALMDSLGRHGRSRDDAGMVFEIKLLKRKQDVVPWNALLTAKARHGNMVEVREIFHGMLLEGVEADSVTLASLIAACSRYGMVRDGCKWFGLMEEDFGVQRSRASVSCVVDLLGRCGEIGEASELVVSKGGGGGDAVLLWKTLLSCSVLQCDVGRGEDAAWRVLDEEPDNAEAHILVSNLYSSIVNN